MGEARLALATAIALLPAACGASVSGAPHGAPRDARSPATSVAAAQPDPPRGPRCPVPPGAGAGVDPSVARTDIGPARGVLADGVRAWRGLPYAAPPVGARRWRPPEDAACLSGVYDATAVRAGCVQVTPSGRRAAGGEDCLYLNVWAKDGARGAPVVVYLHGGTFADGAAGAYDGARLAARSGAAVVTVDYRLGALAAPDLALLDAVAAVAWVKRNAQAFGGDAARLTVFGEGAGATLALALLERSDAAGLVAGAVLDGPYWERRARADVAASRAAVAAKLGCEGDACAARSAEDVATALPPVDERGFRWAPPGSDAPAVVRVPVIVGAGADDAATYDYALHGEAAPDDEIAYVKAARARLAREGVSAADVDRVMKLYPYASFTAGERALVAMETDRMSTCPARRALRALKGPAYRFVWTHVDENGLDRQYGAARGVELPYLFGGGGSHGFAPLPDERALGDAFVNFVARFAAAGDPNGGALPSWPRWDAASDPYLALDVTPRVAAGADAAACDVWDSIAR
jgi:para-nitrobenzyl esterase